MPGVRLVATDPDLRGQLYLVEHPTRKYIVPKICAECQKVHVYKTYHLKLDPFDGSVIVSREIFQRLREAGLPNLEAANEVTNPPPQKIEIGGLLLPNVAVKEARVRHGRAALYKNRLVTPRRVRKEG